jgi:proline iminopeptidase
MTRDEFIAYRRSVPRPPRLERQTVEAGGISFAVYSTPRIDGATPLLCVNGGLLYGHQMLWPALSPLAQGRQLVFYDQRGRGDSTPPPRPDGVSIEHDAADIPGIRRALGIRQWDILGHSWGGGIAMLAAERDGEAARRVVTVGAVGPTSDWMPELEQAALARLAPAERAVLARLTPAMLAEADPDVQSAWSRAIYPAWFADRSLAAFFSPPRSTSVTGAAVASRLRVEGYDWRPLLRALRSPTLVIHGELDVMPVSVAHELAALLPNAEIAVLPGSGHMPFWEAPATFFARCESFLTAPP